ncbi:MAG: flagellar biosynthesis protein FliQ [Spirochaetia bacterium]|jgi:flagellar biosynthetic protein FliQ|nr:flagellar biosynthesis protein FliQ [Spirochaetia bacterium]
MSIGFASMIMRDGIFQVLIIAAPVLVIGMSIGLIVSIFQATTSIQEQTLTFVPKIVAIFLTLAFFSPWMFSSMREFTLNLFKLIPEMIG